MTRLFQFLPHGALTAALLAATLVFSGRAEAQVPVYHAVWQPATLHYRKVYQGSAWRWSPTLGWHWHDYYVAVPHWVPGRWVYVPVYPQPVPVVFESR